MDIKKKVKKVSYKEINSQQEAVGICRDMKRLHLELRLQARQGEIKDYRSQKRAIKKNIACALTFISLASKNN
jgi:ribosomal protein L29